MGRSGKVTRMQGLKVAKSSAKTVKANKDGIQKQRLGTIDKRVKVQGAKERPSKV